MTHWAILTGEYPPQPGGVADYTQLVATGLYQAGDKVTVFAPKSDASDIIDESGVQTIRLPDHFGPRGLLTLDRHLSRVRPDRILVQYVPHAYGYKAMNLLFASWLAMRARQIAPVWVMFHEVMFPIEKGQSFRHALLGRVTYQMARCIARSADRIFVSIPAWAEFLKRMPRVGDRIDWLPIPATITTSNVNKSAPIRPRQFTNQFVVGTFGTFGHATAPILNALLQNLLRANRSCSALLVGRESVRYLNDFINANPDLSEQIHATGEASPEEVSSSLRACDVLIQPYIDGASTRRTSLMAGIALGVPVVTNRGVLSEEFWGVESDGVTVAETSAPERLVAEVMSLLALPVQERIARGRTAAEWYQSRFSIEHTIAKLREVKS